MYRLSALLSGIFFMILLAGCTGNGPEAAKSSVSQEPKKQEDIYSLSKIKNKNELISMILKLTTSGYLEKNGFGKMRDFAIDTESKSFTFSVDLKGESMPLRVAVSKYEIVHENGKLYFVVKNISTDKEWLNLAAKKFLQETKLEIPSKYSIFVMLVM